MFGLNVPRRNKMKRIFIVLALIAGVQLSAAAGHCRKCEIMNKYHSEHSGSQTYYEDYLESIDKTKTEGEAPAEENLPDDVRQIMKQEKVSADSKNVQKK